MKSGTVPTRTLKSKIVVIPQALKNRVINLRINAQSLDVIERAAALFPNSDRTKYILEAAYKAAENDLLDRRNFILTDDAFTKLEQILNAPPRNLPKLKALLKEKAPWQK